MKKVIGLMAAAALVLCLASTGMARHVTDEGNADLKTYGMFITGAQYVDNTYFEDDEAHFTAGQRLRQFFEYKANENLKATVGYEFNETWGDGDNGGEVSADATGQLQLKRANVAFTFPDTELTTKAGIQWVALPGGGLGSNPVMSGDVAGLTMSAPLSDKASLTFGWLRPFDSNRDEDQSIQPGLDVFYAAAPINMDGIGLTPWAAYGMIGDDALVEEDWDFTYPTDPPQIGQNPTFGIDYSANTIGLVSGEVLDKLVTDSKNDENPDSVAAALDEIEIDSAYWLGTTYDLTMMDPVQIKGSIIYGAVEASKD